MNVVSGTRRMRFGKRKNVLCWCIKPSLSFGRRMFVCMCLYCETVASGLDDVRWFGEGWWGDSVSHEKFSLLNLLLEEASHTLHRFDTSAMMYCYWFSTLQFISCSEKRRQQLTLFLLFLQKVSTAEGRDGSEVSSFPTTSILCETGIYITYCCALRPAGHNGTRMDLLGWDGAMIRVKGKKKQIIRIDATRSDGLIRKRGIWEKSVSLHFSRCWLKSALLSPKPL